MRGRMRGICTTAMCLSTSRLRAISSRTMRLSDLLSNCGNGCAGSIASGVSTGPDLRVVIILHPGQVRPAPAPPAPAAGCRWPPAPACSSLAPAGVLLLHHAAHPLDDGAEGFASPSGRPCVRSTTSLSICCLMPGDAHLEELVQVGADDAEELHPLQQRVLRVAAPPPARAG